MAGNDFVFVQLTPQGEAQAGNHPLRVSGRTSIEFAPGIPKRVARYEWDMMLKNYETTHGLPLFEIVTVADPISIPVFSFAKPKDVSAPPATAAAHAAPDATTKETK